VCFDLDSLPPIRPISGAAVEHRDLVLEAADGNRFAAFGALPDAPLSSGVLVFPDVRGLYRFYEELALRLAERGYAALAFDYFGRTAGVGKRDDDFEYMPHVQQTTPEGVQVDAAAAIAWLRSEEGGSCERIFSLGFCYGGRNSWLAAASGHGLAGAIGFYGRPVQGRDGSPGPAQRASEIECPILALQAGADHATSAEDNAAFDAALTASRRRARDRHVPRRSAQLLRSQAGGVRVGERGRLEPHHRVPGALRLAVRRRRRRSAARARRRSAAARR
jgi:carboxymethylenebutenolidase